MILIHYLDLNEKKKHGTDEFPIAYYYVDERYPRYQMPLHWHIELEIIHIIQGEMQIQYNDDTFTAYKDDIIFVNEGAVHGGTPKECQYECIVLDSKKLLVTNELCKKKIQKIINRSTLIKNHFTTEDVQFHHYVETLFDCVKNMHEENELMIIGILFQIFAIILKQNLYEAKQSDFDYDMDKVAQIKPVLEYIDAYYDIKITLEDLSQIACMSPKYFCKYFKTFYQTTPMTYLNEYRIDQACRMLNTTTKSATEVALACGFNDISYFVKTFKKYKGITPKQYQLQKKYP